MAFDVDQLDITTRLVFGTSTPGSDPNTHIRPDATTSQPPSMSLKMSDYLTEGAGRYALPSRAPIVSAFFSDVTSRKLPDGTYTLAQLRTALSLGVGGDGSTLFNVSQYITGTTSSDFMERAYIFGSTGFELKDNMRFVVNGLNYTIENLEVIALQDNFDFQSSNPIAIAGNVLLKSAFDPYGLIPEASGVTVPVDIIYTGAGRIYASYGLGSYLLDQVSDLANTVTPLVALARFQAEVAGLVTNTGYLGTMNGTNRFSYKTADGKKIIYGSPNDDTINVLSAEVTADIYFSYQMVGGTGNDTITGGVFDDEIWGGEGNDLINGGLGDDIFIGGTGDDSIDGGQFLFGLFAGDDKSIYSGALPEYDLEFLPDNSVRIVDSNSSRDGTDTLTGVEKAVFKDTTINLAPGQDIAFVVDTTGSMEDDIDAVKASATNIINTIFAGDKGFLNSRIAVVGYNDPYTETFLSFTDQPKISDRKAAALAGINKLYASGGGDYPESVNAGLIRALSGGAGTWRKEAAARRIILFGDAPPNDPGLRAEVLRLASNIGVEPPASFRSFSVSDEITTSSVTSGLSLTTFSITAQDTDGTVILLPVEIYTVFIGFDPNVRRDFESLSNATGGKLFSAADASKVVEALLAAISTPVNAPPIARDDFITTLQATAVRVSVLANDSDPESIPLKIIGFSSLSAQGGSLSLFDNGTPADFADDQIIYTPAPGFTGSDSFGYTISDGKAAASALVSVAVNDRLRYVESTAGDHSFTLSGGSSGTANLKISLSGAVLDSPYDLALFTVDDLQGRINSIDPSDPAYISTALSRAKNLFSVISNLPQGFNPLSGNRVLELNSGDHFRFLLIKNGTLDSASQQPTGPANTILSSTRNVTVSQSSQDQFILSWKDFLGIDKISNLQVKIEATDEPMALDTKLQDMKRGELLDLSGVDPAKQARASFVVNREAGYDNVVGFYKITDSLGSITDPLTGATLKPGDSGYTQVALRYRAYGTDLQVANQSTATGSILLQGGSVFAPFIVANGTPEQLLDSNPSNDVPVYFPFLAANSDGIDHIRLLADNTFGFEDLPGGGDLDYNDMIIAVSLAV